MSKKHRLALLLGGLVLVSSLALSSARANDRYRYRRARSGACYVPQYYVAPAYGGYYYGGGYRGYRSYYRPSFGVHLDFGGFGHGHFGGYYGGHYYDHHGHHGHHWHH